MMILKIDYKVGDGFHNRLLLLLKSKLGDDHLQLHQIKEGKWMLQTSSDRWFVKLYPTMKRLQLQKKVTKALLEEGFLKVPDFHRLHNEERLEIQGNAVGLTQWINTGSVFTYNTFLERQRALSTLEEFHHSSRKALLKEDSSLSVPKQNLINKWVVRLEEFMKNRQTLLHYLPQPYVDSYIKLGEEALEGLYRSSFSKEKYILHGDLAHHNFLMNAKRELFIIDLDLISSGPKEIDHIQFANRIFPYINWSLDSLWNHESLADYKENKAFLYALLYPSDVFREWNRFFREGSIYQRKVWNYLRMLTVDQFPARMLCCKEVKARLN